MNPTFDRAPPKCWFCRHKFSPEEARIQCEMCECYAFSISTMTGIDYDHPNADAILSWGTAQDIAAERQRKEADKFFFGTPSSNE